MKLISTEIAVSYHLPSLLQTGVSSNLFHRVSMMHWSGAGAAVKREPEKTDFAEFKNSSVIMCPRLNMAFHRLLSSH